MKFTVFIKCRISGTQAHSLENLALKTASTSGHRALQSDQLGWALIILIFALLPFLVPYTIISLFGAAISAVGSFFASVGNFFIVYIIPHIVPFILGNIGAFLGFLIAVSYSNILLLIIIPRFPGVIEE